MRSRLLCTSSGCSAYKRTEALPTRLACEPAWFLFGDRGICRLCPGLFGRQGLHLLQVLLVVASTIDSKHVHNGHDTQEPLRLSPRCEQSQQPTIGFRRYHTGTCAATAHGILVQVRAGSCCRRARKICKYCTGYVCSRQERLYPH